MPVSVAAERISTDQTRLKPLISREIQVKLAAEMEDQAGGIRDRAFSGPALANFH
jgi:hypothetical protein